MSGLRSRRKGARRELEIVHAHRAIGVAARKVPLSGAAEGWKGDLRIPHGDTELWAEVKARANGEGFRTLERWIEGMQLLFLRRDRATPLVLLTWDTYVRLLKGGEGGKEAGSA